MKEWVFTIKTLPSRKKNTNSLKSVFAEISAKARHAHNLLEKLKILVFLESCSLWPLIHIYHILHVFKVMHLRLQAGAARTVRKWRLADGRTDWVEARASQYG